MRRYADKVLSASTGMPIVGATVAVYLAGTKTLATIYQTNDVSGPVLANPFVATGEFAFYPPNGEYDITVKHGGRSTTLPNVGIYDPATYRGPAGASNNTRLSLDELQSADPEDETSLYDGDLWFFVPGDFSAQVDDAQVVKHTSTPATEGAWVRQTPEINIATYGFGPTSTPAENLAALKKAAAYLRVAGGTLFFPPTAPLQCRIDTSGGRSEMAVFDRSCRLRIDSWIKATTTSQIGVNPSCLFVINGDDVLLEGAGKLFGSGAINDVNAGTDETMPCLLYVTGNNFTFRDLSIDKHPKIGLHLYNCRNADVAGNFIGGPLAYGDTSYFHIRTTAGGGHKFSSRFVQGADGGRTVQCIFMSGTHRCRFDNIQAAAGSFYEKAVYGFGNYNVFNGGVIAGDPGIVPGTNLQGCVTLPIRFHGSYNRVSNAIIVGCAGGAQMMDGIGPSVENCRLINCGQTAISAYNSSLSYASICGNVCTVGNLQGFIISSGIYVAANAGSKFLTIDDNVVTGFSVDDPLVNLAAWQADTEYPRTSAIKPLLANGRYYVQSGPGGKSGIVQPTWPTTPGATVADGDVVWITLAYEANQSEIRVLGAGPGNDAISHSRICNNTTAGGRNGVHTNYVVYSKIAGNKADCSLWGMSENNGAFNRWEWYEVTGTSNTTVQNLAVNSTDVNYLAKAWTPARGAQLSVTGVFSSTGSYERIGRTVHYRGDLVGSVDIEAASGILTDLPVTPARRSAGSILTTTLSGGNCGVLQGQNAGVLYSTAIAKTGAITFAITYEGVAG